MHARLITRHPFVVLAVLAALTAFQGWHALRLGVDFTLEGLFLTEAPELVIYRSFRDTFGPDDHQVFVLFKVDDVFAPGPLAALDRLTARIEKLPGVRGTLSLARFKGLAGQYLAQLKHAPKVAVTRPDAPDETQPVKAEPGKRETSTESRGASVAARHRPKPKGHAATELADDD